uniref:GTP cyclohydrolase I n=1 Tax=viral metagenome TaxID=1070528 RepID=A0A6M3XPD7_9ZZZZ
MPKTFICDEAQFMGLARSLSTAIKESKKRYDWLHAVPQGGAALGGFLSASLGIPLITEKEAYQPVNQGRVLVVDDLVDSGVTRQRFMDFDFACLHIKEHTPRELYPTYWVSSIPGWVDYWWENGPGGGIQENVTRIIEYLGEDPTREGLKGTPLRVVASWKQLFGGYTQNPKDLFKTFAAQGYDQMVLLRDIEFHSTCEHHMLPFSGKAHVAYIPSKGGRVLGVSKLARLVDVFARRLQIQERIGDQVTAAIMENLNPLGAACILEAKHLCMVCRGVQKQNSVMMTSSLKGLFLEDSDNGRAARAELMGLVKG